MTQLDMLFSAQNRFIIVLVISVFMHTFVSKFLLYCVTRSLIPEYLLVGMVSWLGIMLITLQSGSKRASSEDSEGETRGEEAHCAALVAQINR